MDLSHNIEVSDAGAAASALDKEDRIELVIKDIKPESEVPVGIDDT